MKLVFNHISTIYQAMDLNSDGHFSSHKPFVNVLKIQYISLSDLDCHSMNQINTGDACNRTKFTKTLKYNKNFPENVNA